LTALGSAPLPEPSPADHLRGPSDARVLIEYADFECPFCAALKRKLEAVEVRLVFRHFPVRSSHPRAWAAACAAEAASNQGRFWEMHDLLFSDQGRLEDPHLWGRAEALGLDVERFESDRRSQPVLDRIRADFQSGVRAGVVTTPTLFADGRMLAGGIGEAELAKLV
jgi:protein-disulfide isomerase